MNRREVIAGAVIATALGSTAAVAGTGVSSNAYIADMPGFRAGEVRTQRHFTSYIEAGPISGPLMIFVHGHPELAITWKWQMAHFAQKGWRCVAPDMRGYGGSSVPTAPSAYTVREISTDMAELHDALGGTPAVWVGHDWGAPIVWAMASNHPKRCRAIVNMSIPYLARGFALPHLVATVDRKLYPIEQYPVGQWDYWLYYREQFAMAQLDFEANATDTIAALFRSGDPKAIEAPAFTATVREKGGWFGQAHRAPSMSPDPRLLTPRELRTYASAFEKTGFGAANAWYLNDAANIAFAGEAANFGRLDMSVLYVHCEHDAVCETFRNRKIADPMRSDCKDLSEVKIASGHFPMLERRDEVNRAMTTWLSAKRLVA